MIAVSPTVTIDENEIQYAFLRASGPGGQNVNKVASSVQLRFDIRHSPSLDADVKARLIKLAGSRVTEEGILIIEASRYRSQEQNRQDALRRLLRFISLAAQAPKRRKKTRPTLESKKRRLEEKRRRGAIKRLRQDKTQDIY
jgi:ribosome-associated protein